MKKTILLFAIIISGYFLFGQNVGVDQTNPVNKLDVNGNLSVGSNYSGTFTAPSNGAIFEGQVGIGTAMPMADLDVNGTLRVGSLIGAGTSMVVADANGNLSIQTIPTDGQTLSLSGSNLSISGGNSISLPFALPYSAGTGINISGSTIINTGDTDPSNDITTSTSAAGDVSGIFPTLSVDKIKGQNIAGTAPANGQVLKWNGSAWAPAVDDAGTTIWNQTGTTAYYNAGRVGIGLTNPTGQLTVRTDSTAISGDNVKVNGLSLVLDKFSNSNTNNAVGIGFGSSTNFGGGNPSIGAAIIHQRTNGGSFGKLHFATKPTFGLSEDIPIRMTIAEGGNVGIGTTSPGAKLSVSNGTTEFQIRPGMLDGAVNNDWTTFEMPGNKNFRIWDNLSVSDKIAIGTTTVATDAHLMVNGNIRVADDADIFGLDQIVGFNDLRLSGDATGGPDLLINANGTVGVNIAYTNTDMNVTNDPANLFILSCEFDNGNQVFEVLNNNHVNSYSDFGVINADFDVVGGTKNFKLDHPLDPANKNLRHNAVESPDHVTYYHGTVVLDGNGSAKVDLPPYFEALNKDFHYQLTCVGGFAQVYISKKIANNQFSIAGGTPGLEVSWQVSATRNDPWAKDHPYQAEFEKSPENKGKYWYPEGYGKSKSLQISSPEQERVLENE
ncbi:MAG: hypothetical protein KDD99_11210 [Bacteroidetes bacterium]|nr:hypothetical protein [Bacteroidota bacterium]